MEICAGPMNALLKDLPQIPLTPEREQELFAAGDLEAIVLHALVPAFNYAQNIGKGAPARPLHAEVLSICFAALSRSIKTFKPGMQSFLAYSKPFLRGEMCRYWCEKNVVRNAFRHEAPEEEDEFPKPIACEHVEPAWESIHWKELWAQVEPVMRKTLKPIEIRVLEYRYKFSMTLEETGEQIGRTRARVKQIESEAMEKLRGALSNRLRL